MTSTFTRGRSGEQHVSTTGPGPIFVTPAGTVRGWLDDGVVRATGVPYATARRFEPPKAVTSLMGHASAPGLAPAGEGEHFEATSWAPQAPQVSEPTFQAVFGPEQRTLGMSEDCLRLSVTMPAGTGLGDKLPVMVWVHGGSYVAGCADSSLTDPAELVREHRVVVVTVSYRLGLMGFMGLDRVPANLGLLDQIEALRWVRRSIAAFGGDPGRVTAFGESAGADALAHLLVAMGAAEAGPLEPGELLFDRAILLSPPLGIRHGRTRMNAVMQRYVQRRLRPAMPVSRVLHLQQRVLRRVSRMGLQAMMPFGVQYGHAPLPPERDVEAAWRTIARRIPIMIGTVGTETSLFTHFMPAAQWVAALPRIGQALYWRLVEHTSRVVFLDSAHDLARLWQAAGGTARRFSIPWSAPGNPVRSPHAIDVALMCAREDTWSEVLAFRGATWTQVEQAARDVRRYLAEFGTWRTLHPHTQQPRAIRTI